MAFDDFENSNEQGRRVALFRLQWGQTQWFYTSADRLIEFAGQNYTPVPINHGGLKQGGSSRGDMTITLSAGEPVVALFRGTPPSTPVLVEIRHLHLDDPDLEARLYFTGRIGNVRRVPDSLAEIVCRPLGLKKSGLRLTWSRGCTHFLYGSGCRVNKDDFATPATITAIEGNIVTVDVLSPSLGYFNGGFIEWDADGLGTIERRAVEREIEAGRHKLFNRSDGLTIGQTVTFFPGCDLTDPTCKDKFNNLANFGGVNFMPGKSPFEGRSLI